MPRELFGFLRDLQFMPLQLHGIPCASAFAVEGSVGVGRLLYCVEAPFIGGVCGEGRSVVSPNSEE